ncbi:hypothetical protein NM688_g6352 [Phlebia brevispora]|uniref:Uncharacterized protein n=1 Tax=Phlebia brevispora TaxID=194682 RepID=A0ACC1SH36_9APHY|nr:hypothetical protein NM688_g6352 [Phlebia brevispora]
MSTAPKAKKGKKQQKTASEQDSKPFAQMPSPAAKIDNKLLLHAALNLTSPTGIFFDTKFFAFSRRKIDGTVYAPKGLYSNGWLLRTRLPSYFEQLLSDTFGDCMDGDLSGGFPLSHQPYTRDYDYDDDSDLEDDQDDEGSTDSSFVQLGRSAAAGSNEQSEAEASTLHPEPGESTADADSLKGKARDNTTSAAVASETNVTGKIVVLPYIAYDTWKTLMFYLSTGEVSFKRLKSQGEVLPVPIVAEQLSSPPSCSPKSIYRIADRLGLDELKDKAKQDILTKLTSENILDELFSGFTCTYDDIRQAEVDFACGDTSRRQDVITRLPRSWRVQISRLGNALAAVTVADIGDAAIAAIICPDLVFEWHHSGEVTALRISDPEPAPWKTFFSPIVKALLLEGTVQLQ